MLSGQLSQASGDNSAEDVKQKIEVGKQRSIRTWLKRNQYEFAAFLILFIFNFVLSLNLKLPFIIDDYHTMANAAFLSGKYFNWSTAYSTSAYYGYGFSSLFIPLFWLTNNVLSVFKAVYLVNSILTGLIGVLAVRIGKEVLPQIKIAVLFSAVCAGLYPILTNDAKLADNELPLMFTAWLLAYLFVILTRAHLTHFRRIIVSFLLGFVCVFSYSVHGRGIGLILAAFLSLLIYMIVIRKKILCFLPFSAAGILFGAGDYFAKHYIINNLIDNDQAGSVLNTPTYMLSKFAKFLNTDYYYPFLKDILYHSYYIVAASFGLVVLGVFLVFMMWRKMKKTEDNAEQTLFGFSLISFFMIFFAFFISVFTCWFAFITMDGERLETYMYGRYFEGFFPLILFFIFMYLLRYGMKKRMAALYTVCSMAVLAVGTLQIGPNFIFMNELKFSPKNAGSLIPFAGRYLNTSSRTMTDFYILFAVVSVVLVVVCVLLTAKKIKIAAILLSVLFVYSSSYTMITYFYPKSESYTNTINRKIIGSFSGLEPLLDKYPYVYQYDPLIRDILLQYAFPEVNTMQLEFPANDLAVFSKLTENSFILSSRNLNLDNELADCVRINEPNGMYLYAYGSKLINEITELNIPVTDSNGISYFAFSLQNGDTARYLMNTPVYQGTYSIRINGSNIDQSAYSISYATIDGEIIPTRLEVFPDHADIVFDSPYYDEGIYVDITPANADIPVTLTDLFLTGMSARKSAAEFASQLAAGHFYDRTYFNLYNGGSAGSTSVHLSKGSSTYCSLGTFVEGEYTFVLKGSDLSSAEIEFIEKNGEITGTIVEIERTSDTITWQMNLSEPVNDLFIDITSPASGNVILINNIKMSRSIMALSD